jgi:hypothetical protein
LALLPHRREFIMPKQNSPSHAGYATCSDFCKSFAADLHRLYLLAFLLTGTQIAAEQCFVSTLEEAVAANYVFKGWEGPWSKRCLIINAIRLVFPNPIGIGGKREVRRAVDVELGKPRSINAVAGLSPALQRLAFVMSVLERYSTHECALLVGCTPREVVEARTQALWQLSGFDSDLARSSGQGFLTGGA